MSVNTEEFNKLKAELDKGHALNLKDLGRVFGEDFWCLITLVMCFAKEGSELEVCEICGTLVANTDSHQEFHSSLSTS